MFQKYTRILLYFLMVLPLFSGQTLFADELEEIRKKGKIYVAFTSDDLENINYPLALEFAKYLNVDLEIVEIEWEDAFSKNGVLPDGLQTDPSVRYTPDVFQKADLISSTFTVLPWRKKLFDFASTMISTEVLVVRKESPDISSLNELKGKTVSYMGNTSYADHIHAINDRIGGGIILDENQSNDEAKQKLREGHTDAIILDADEALTFMAAEDAYKLALPVSTPTKVAWVVEKGNDLAGEVEGFFQTIENNGILDSLFRQYFRISYSDYSATINPKSSMGLRTNDLDGIVEDGKIVIALRDRDFVFHEKGKKQLMHFLAEEFAWYLGLEVEFVTTKEFSQYFENSNGEIDQDSIYSPEWFNSFDVACDLISPDPWREKIIDMVEVFPVHTVIIAPQKTRIRTKYDLKNKIAATTRGSVYDKILKDFGVDSIIYRETKDLLATVDSGWADYTVFDEPFFSLKEFPDLEKKITIGESSINWAIKKGKPQLKNALEQFIQSAHREGLLDLLIEIQNDSDESLANDLLSDFHNARQPGKIPSEFYSTQNLLPFENVLSLFQDRRGYIWLGTEFGLVRYNGREMQRICAERISLPVLDILQREEAYFVLTPQFLYCLNADYQIQDSLALDPGAELAQSQSGRLFLKTPFNVQSLSLIDGMFLNEEILDQSAIQQLVADSAAENLYGIINGKLFQFNLADKSLNITNRPASEVYMGIDNNLWVFNEGLASIKASKSNNFEIRKPFPKQIKSVFNAGDVGFWMLAGNQLYRQQSMDKRGVVLSRASGLKARKINAALQDHEGNLWVAYEGGLQKFLMKSGVRVFEGMQHEVSKIFQDQQNSYWMLTNNGLYRMRPGKSAVPKRILSDSFKDGGIAPDNLLFFYTNHIVRFYNPAADQWTHFQAGFVDEIMDIKPGDDGNFYMLAKNDGEVVLYTLNSNFKILKQFKTGLKEEAQLYVFDNQLMIQSANQIFELSEFDFKSVDLDENLQINDVLLLQDVVYIATDLDLIRIGEQNDEVLFSDGSPLIQILPGRNKNIIWIATTAGIYKYNLRLNIVESELHAEDGLPANEIIKGGMFLDNKGILWLSTYHGMATYSPKAGSHELFAPVCFIDNMSINGEKSRLENGQKLKHNQNNLVFELTALSYSDESAVEYEFYLRGLHNDYQSYSKGKDYLARFTNLPPGDYEFVYKARAKDKLWAYARTLNFSISKPFWETWLFRILALVLITLIVWMLYRWRLHRLEQQKRVLEGLVKERTHQLEQANEELESQIELVSRQKEEITVQKEEIELKNQNITDSIRYAKRIQEAILPQDKLVKQRLEQSFILYKPKDIVSGDFYWMHSFDDKILFAAVDCTGHGVPGAFVSLVGHTALNRTVKEFGIFEPGRILDKLNDLVLETFRQQGTSDVKDGMDMALCLVDAGKKQLQFAGANNPLFLIRDNELQEIKATKKPIGSTERKQSYENHVIDLQKDDCIYVFSDGFADQFGGPKDRKFMSRNFKKLLLSAHDRPMGEQREILNETIENWRGEREQIDDILVIGYRF